LLHATSLPGPHGSGDLGEEARAFARFLARAGQRWWQMLPVGPPGFGDSPYSALSAFAGSPLLVDLDALGVPIDPPPFADDGGGVDWARAIAFRERHLRRAFEAFSAGAPASERRAFEAFSDREARWLDDFALFAALKRAHGGVEWTRWERGVRLRKKDALARARKDHAAEIDYARFVQFRFDAQWRALRASCAELGVGLIGDLPIFVAHDSADVWQHRELFHLDAEGMPTVIAGVPPDYFSATGQRWGNPQYDWARHRETGFAWWLDRFRSALERFDAIRIDHFIGFVRSWHIPADEPTAMNGTWVPAPGRELFAKLREAVGARDLPLVAEDLGLVTREVTKLRTDLRLPGIRLVQFAFGTDPQAPKFYPHAHVRRAVVYTGTHDNDTIVGWFFDPGGGADSTRTPDEAEAERHHALAYLGREGEDLARLEIHWEMIRLTMSSVARTAILPVQDVLGLGSEARMNRPGKPAGNWRWRLAPGALDGHVERKLREVTRTYGRAPRAGGGGAEEVPA
jgi:4-alpha-glucanotransferase